MPVDFFLKYGKLNILREDKDFFFIQKPSGLLVHPIKCHSVAISPKAKLFNRVNPDKYSKEKTLADFLLEKHPDLRQVGETQRPGIVHRLDKEVSGIMVVAKNQKMYEHLVRQFQEKKTQKKYFALVFNSPREDKGEINSPIGRNNKGKIVVVDYLKKVKNKKSALTLYQVKEKFLKPQKFSLLDISPLTGRTNQIRVHLKSINCPIVGDEKYKKRDLFLKKPLEIKRIFLHAYYLGFYDLNNQWVEFKIGLPLELEQFLNKLRNQNV